jgi:hypothetical protein
MQGDTLRQEYSSMSNEELVILQSDQGALTDEAQLLLAEEIRHRDLSEKRSAISPDEGGSHSSLAKSHFASSLLTTALYALLVSFVLRVSGVPLEINIPGTLIVFLIWYFVSIKRKNRK